MPDRPRELPTIYFDNTCFYIETRLREFREHDAPYNRISFDHLEELYDESSLLLYDRNTKNAYTQHEKGKPLPEHVVLFRLPPIRFLDPVGLALWGKLREDAFVRKGTDFFMAPDKKIKETYGFKEAIKRATPRFGSYDLEIKDNKFGKRK